MTKKKYDKSEGVWRTIGGRRVFIRTGQSLSDAMKESGKFKKKDEEKRNIKTITQEEYDKLPNDYKGTLKELVDTAEFRGENKEELRKFYEKQGFNIEEDKTILENENGGTILRPVKVNKSEDKYKGLTEEGKRIVRGDFKNQEEKDMWEKAGKETEELLNNDKFYTRKDGTKEYDPYKGTRFEKKYDSVEDRYNKDKDFRDMLKGEHEKTLKATRGEINSYFDLENRDEKIGNKDDLYKMINENYYNVSKEDFEKLYSEEASARYNKVDKEWTDLAKKMEKDYDEYGTNNYKDVSKLNKLSRDRDYYSLYSNEKLNWREQVKKNNELMEKELEDYKKKHDISRESDGYYEIFRNNERRNAKIKQEVPTEPYEYVEAYAGYHDKSYKLAGTKMSGKDVVEYGTKSWTGKEYTNDEFMEHLTDSNWHQERKMLEEAKLTNQELAYIKDRTTLSQWSVGEELTGSKNVEKMIKEAKNHFASSSSNLMNRYTGTVDYLKQTTNMSGAEILELLKRIDEDKK